MASAICIRCGNSLRRWGLKCSRCSFNPQNSDETMAMSYILSTERYDGGDGLPLVAREYSSKELDKIGEHIHAGQAFKFDPEEVHRVVEVMEAVRSIPERVIWRTLFHTFLPAIIFFLVLIIILVVLKRL